MRALPGQRVEERLEPRTQGRNLDRLVEKRRDEPERRDLQLRARILEETQLHHHAMTASSFDLLRARPRQLEAEIAYLEAKLEYWLAHAAALQLEAGRRPNARAPSGGRLMQPTRRQVLAGGAALGGVLVAKGSARADRSPPDRGETGELAARSADGPEFGRVVTPNGESLPWREVDGVKVFHLVAEPVEHEIGPGIVINAWGYNGRVHGPTIEAVEGDRCRFYVTNRLPGPTTVHWHGIILPNGMDGVGGLTQPYIRPGETFRYEFSTRHPGTFMYHPHLDEMTQIAFGLTGIFVVHPRQPATAAPRARTASSRIRS